MFLLIAYPHCGLTPGRRSVWNPYLQVIKLPAKFLGLFQLKAITLWIFPLRLRALLVSNSLLIHPVAKNGPRPLSLTRKNAKGPAMFWGHSQNFVFGILRSLELRTQITQFLDTCWIFFDVRLMLVDFSCKPSLAFCV